MKTNKKKWLLIASVLIAVTIGSVYAWHYHRQHEMLKVEVKPFKTGNGWGYDIMVDKKIFIHQETIPAIAGNRSFSSEHDAVKTGNLVVKKLVKGKFPSLTSEEITKLGIHPVSAMQQ